MPNFLFFLSVAPFALFLFLLLGKKTSLRYASTATLTLVTATTVFFWQIIPVYILTSFLKGFLVAFDIFVIIFGAVFFLEILTKIKVIENVGYYLKSFSKDYRVQVILLAWFFEGFIEGTAGFGTPAAIVAPLLIGLGLSPLTAVIIGLLGNSTAVVFGAAGTPIRVGFAGITTPSIPIYAALFNLVGLLVPVFMLWVLVASQKDKRGQFLEGLPFAIWSGIAFVVPSMVVAVFFGQEFPSIIGSIIGLALVSLTTKLGLFLPKHTRSLRQTIKPAETLPLLKVVFPYALLITLLIIGKLFLGSINLALPIGNHTVNFFNPGLAFLAAGLPVALLWEKRKLPVLTALKVPLRRTIEPFLVIVAMSTLVQLMINSGQNLSGFPSSLELIAKNFETAALPFFAPIVGAFGAFITGSATVSNLMFGHFLHLASKVQHLDVSKILALELVGAAAGNMIALADILAAEAIVGLKNQERKVLKGVIVPCAIYLLLVGLVGILIT